MTTEKLIRSDAESVFVVRVAASKASRLENPNQERRGAEPAQTAKKLPADERKEIEGAMRRAARQAATRWP